MWKKYYMKTEWVGIGEALRALVEAYRDNEGKPVLKHIRANNSLELLKDINP